VLGNGKTAFFFSIARGAADPACHNAAAALRCRCYRRRLFLVGSFLRLVFAKSRNCFSLIELAICREAPLSEDFDLLPRFAASAAPAAICCFLDLAGIQHRFVAGTRVGFAQVGMPFRQSK
jgi:hypothetical protein